MKKIVDGVLIIALGIVVGWGVYWAIIRDSSSAVRTERGNNSSKTEIIPTEVVEKEINIAIMADVHNDLVSLKKGLELAKIRGNEMVIVAGDLTINGTEKELIAIKNVLDESGFEYYAVPGNHDLYKGVENYRSVFGDDYGIVEEEGRTHQSARTRKIILINNGSWRGLGKEQTAWIEKEVEECRIIYCLAIMHMPLNHNFSTHVMGEKNKTVTAEANYLRDLLVSNNIKEVVTGHLHYSTAYTLDDLTTIIAGAMSKERNTQTPRFTEVRIGEGKFEKEVIVL